MNHKKLAEMLFPHINQTIEDCFKKYPPRKLAEGAVVTRVAPSPTGEPHIGTLYQCVLDSKVAHQSKGVFVLRIEDTDSKREVAGGIEKIFQMMQNFDSTSDEGAVSESEEVGNYGPYIQSKRKELYQIFAKELVARGRAYPCFCKNDDEDDSENKTRNEEQRKAGVPLGYHTNWAKCRNLTFDQIKAKLDAGEKFTIRIKADGDGEQRVVLFDEVRGKFSIPKNFIDAVLLKSDGQAVYHMGHLVDDSLMHITHVMRDESYLSTWPLHVQMFEFLDLTPPKYVHTAQIMTIDKETGNARKVSKRHDPWARVSWFAESGYPPVALKEYCLNLLNSSFEPWREQNPDAPLSEFVFSISNMSKSGAMFDLVKLNDVSKNVIGKMTAEEVYNKTLEWAKTYDANFANILQQNKEKSVAAFAIERYVPRPRKDVYMWSMLKDTLNYIFFAPTRFEIDETEKEKCREVLVSYAGVYNQAHTKEEWFAAVKEMANKLGYATDNKAYKENPGAFKGNTADVCRYIRVALTGRKDSPDLYEIAKVLGDAEVSKRLKTF